LTTAVHGASVGNVFFVYVTKRRILSRRHQVTDRRHRYPSSHIFSNGSAHNEQDVRQGEYSRMEIGII